MLIVLDPSDSSPLYTQIRRQVIAQIEEGSIREGDRLPTAVELAETLDLNRNTVLQAYRQLRDEGWLELRRGRGTIARNPGGAMEASALERIAAEVAALAKAEGWSLSDITAALKKKGIA